MKIQSLGPGLAVNGHGRWPAVFLCGLRPQTIGMVPGGAPSGKARVLKARGWPACFWKGVGRLEKPSTSFLPRHLVCVDEAGVALRQE